MSSPVLPIMPAAGEPSLDVRYRQGTILTFNQLTLENTVDVGGTTLTNLPLLGVGESTLLTTGSVVGIIVVGDETRGKTMAILGRLVIPASAAAEEAISLLNSQIFAESVAPVFTIAQETATSGDGALYYDGTLYWFEGEPQVTVPVGPSGRVLVTICAHVGNGFTGQINAGLLNEYIDVLVSGANTVNPGSQPPIRRVYSFDNDPGTAGGTPTIEFASRHSLSLSFVIEDLVAGDTTFQMVYAKYFGDTPSTTAEFYRRTITVFKL